MNPPPASDDLSGHSLGAYRILERLGAGGMGYVYLAEDTRLGRQVALKVLPPEMASDSERLERFEREAKAVATLNHPNIVTLHSIEEADGIRFITMERVEGTTLADYAPEGGLPVERLLPLAISLADALSTAHQRGITHRDLKPQNLMVTPEGRLKVLDFGLAKLHETAEATKDTSELKTASVTQDGRILGTVAYMSPEQAQGLGVDHRSDVFSLGIVLYELATGERPFKGGTNLSVLSSVMKDSPPSVTEVKQDLPRPLARMIQRCLEKNPSDRYQSASDLRRDLEDLKRDIETGEVLSSSASHPSLRGAPARGSRPLLLAAAALILALMGAAWVLVSPRSEAPVADSGDSRPSIAVFYFENVTGDPELDWLRTGLTDMLVTDLSQSPALRVLTTAQLHQILADMGTLDVRTVTLEMIQAVAHEAQVGRALVGSFVKAGDRIRIQAQLQDTASGEVVAAERVEGAGEASLFSLVDDLTRRIKARLEPPTVAGAATDVDRDLEDVTTASVEAYRQYAEGMRLHEEFREREALPYLERAAKLDPQFAMALAKLSVLHGNLGDQQKSLDYGRRAFELVDRLTARERYYIEGLHYSRQSDTIDQALAAYSKAVELYPDHSAARTNLATVLLRLERYEDAIGHLETLRRSRTGFPLSYMSLANAYATLDEFEKGFAVLQEYSAYHPDNAAAQVNLGNFLITWGKYDSALEAFAAAERLEGEPREIEAGRWAAHVLAGQRAEAEAAALRLLTLDNPVARFQGYGAKLAMGLLDGRVEEVMAIGEQLVEGPAELGPMKPVALIFGAATLGDLGRLDEAVEMLRPALDAELPDPLWVAAARAQMAVLEARRGNLEASETFLERALDQLEDVPSPIRDRWEAQTRGAVMLARGDAKAAVDPLKQAAELNRERRHEDDQGLAQLWFDLARAYLETGQDGEAERWLRRLSEAGLERLGAPIQYVRSLYLLAELLERRGQTEEAKDLYRRFLDHWGDGKIDRERVEAARKRLSSLEAAAPSS